MIARGQFQGARKLKGSTCATIGPKIDAYFVDSAVSERLQGPNPLTIYPQKPDRNIFRSRKWDRKRVPEGAQFLLNRQEEEILHG